VDARRQHFPGTSNVNEQRNHNTTISFC
jgi:hypothetical protein